MRKIGIALFGLVALTATARASEVEVVCDNYRGVIKVDVATGKLDVPGVQQLGLANVREEAVQAGWYDNNRSVAVGFILDRRTMKLFYSARLIVTRDKLIEFTTSCKRTDGGKSL